MIDFFILRWALLVLTSCLITFFLYEVSQSMEPRTYFIMLMLLTIFGQLCVFEGMWIQKVLKHDGKGPLG